MGSFPEDMQEYKNQLEQGAIQKAYKGLMDYLMGLKTHFKNAYPDCFVSGSLYYGYMDMTCFSFIPPSLQSRNLKIAIVFLHKEFRFEAWLSGTNRQIQSEYWHHLKESDWVPYRLVPDPKSADAILEYTVVEDPDFRDLDALTRQIETGTLQFVADAEALLSKAGV